MMNIHKAWAVYTGTRAETGRNTEALELSQGADGVYYLHRGDLFPLTLGTESEATDALLAAAFGLRNA
ncbi:hypothetical protein ACIRP5_10055 [Streptomyces sp. NPDC101221]|uniref:hypothetical protein n=1 Tax=Streptomyces sp. NPDC101221 TaxID=3366132 RepID=UPI0037F3EACF